MPSKHIGELKVIKLEDIQVAARARVDYGDVEDLAKSIEEKGLICPIAVSVQDTEGLPPYRLEAGGRRFAAHLLLLSQGKIDFAELNCRVFTEPLTLLQQKAIELAENVMRKDLDHNEKRKLVAEIDSLWKEEFGEKVSTSPDAEGHSSRDTAALMGMSPAAVSISLKIDEVDKKFPELKLSECKTQKEALKKVESFSKMVTHNELSAQANKTLKGDAYKLLKSYNVGDCVEGIKGMQPEIFDLIEVDPPFGIKLQSIKKSDLGYDNTYGESYHEVVNEEYEEFLNNLFKECYRVAGRDSWIIVWYAPEPWAEVVYQSLVKAGFSGKRLGGVWTKPTGQCMQPKYNLASTVEHFYYMRKGTPLINKQGRSNNFNFSPVNPNQKVHPTERPLDMMEDLLNTFTLPGSRILVPFAGSGVTLQAAFNLNMFGIGFDLSQEYKAAFDARVLKKEGQ